MRHVETRLARLEARAPRVVGEGQSPDIDALTTPERTAQVAQILVDVGALCIGKDGELLIRASSGRWVADRDDQMRARIGAQV